MPTPCRCSTACGTASLVGGQPRAALEIAQAFLSLAQRTATTSRPVARRAVAWPMLFLGDPAGALAPPRADPGGLRRCDNRSADRRVRRGPGVDWMVRGGVGPLALGDDSGAAAAIDTAVRRVATLGHPLSETYVHTLAALLGQMRDDAPTAHEPRRDGRHDREASTRSRSSQRSRPRRWRGRPAGWGSAMDCRCNVTAWPDWRAPGPGAC